MELRFIVSKPPATLLSDILGFVTSITPMKESSSVGLRPTVIPRSDTAWLTSVVGNQTIVTVRFLALFISSSYTEIIEVRSRIFTKLFTRNTADELRFIFSVSVQRFSLGSTG